MTLPLRRAYSYDYTRVESIVASYISQWRQAGFDAVVAIARGGLVAGMMASTELSLPLYAVGYSRPDRKVSWFTAARPEPGTHVLLVEDVAGRGTTLSDSIEFLQNLGFRVSVFTLAYDDQSRIRPDFGMLIPDGYRAWFPWERTSVTPQFDAIHNQPDRAEFEYASWAIDLDGVLLMDLPEEQYARALQETLAQRDKLVPNTLLPGLDLSQISIITGRPEQDRVRTAAWLNQHGFHGPLVMRDELRHSAPQTSQHKAEAILARCHTHFIESDAAQAIEIAQLATVAKIIWWNGGQAMLVQASAATHLHLI